MTTPPRHTLVHIADMLGPYPALVSGPGWLGWVQRPAFDRPTVGRILDDLRKLEVPIALFDEDEQTVSIRLPKDDFPASFSARADGLFEIGPSWKWEEFRPDGTELDPPVRSCDPVTLRPAMVELLERADPSLILLVLADVAEQRMTEAVTVRDSNRWRHVCHELRCIAPGFPHFHHHRSHYLGPKRPPRK